MQTEKLKRIKYSLTQRGALYSTTQELAPSGETPAYLLPVSRISAIGIQVDSASDLKIEATMATQAQIEADEALWNTWDGTSLFNPAITAIKVTNLSESLSGSFTLTVKASI